MPSCSAALMISVPFGTAISNPSMVTRTSSTCLATSVIGPPGRRLGIVPQGQRGFRTASRRGVERAATVFRVLDELVPEVLDRRLDRADRAVAERAERAAENVVADVEQLVQVGVAALAMFQRVEQLDDPVGALAARRAFAARLVLVELHPAQRRPDDAS